MKAKAYIKLFEFCDPKSWTKDKDSSYISNFYREYKLELKSDTIFWNYMVYRADERDLRAGYAQPSYKDKPCHEGTIRLNLLGRFFNSWVLFGLMLIVQGTFLNIPVFPLDSLKANFLNHYVLYCSYVIFSHLLSYGLVFNFKMNKVLKEALYNVNNKETIREKEEAELLAKEISNIVNAKLASNPRLARKNKLKQLNKISIWKKIGSIFDDDGGYPPLVDEK